MKPCWFPFSDMTHAAEIRGGSWVSACGFATSCDPHRGPDLVVDCMTCIVESSRRPREPAPRMLRCQEWDLLP